MGVGLVRGEFGDPQQIPREGVEPLGIVPARRVEGGGHLLDVIVVCFRVIVDRSPISLDHRIFPGHDVEHAHGIVGLPYHRPAAVGDLAAHELTHAVGGEGLGRGDPRPHREPPSAPADHRRRLAFVEVVGIVREVGRVVRVHADPRQVSRDRDEGRSEGVEYDPGFEDELKRAVGTSAQSLHEHEVVFEADRERVSRRERRTRSEDEKVRAVLRFVRFAVKGPGDGIPRPGRDWESLVLIVPVIDERVLALDRDGALPRLEIKVHVHARDRRHAKIRPYRAVAPPIIAFPPARRLSLVAPRASDPENGGEDDPGDT